MKLKVKCSFIIDVDFSDDPELDPYFQIEENSCPGTGMVWLALKRHIEKHEQSRTCWACALQGKNEILEELKQ